MTSQEYRNTQGEGKPVKPSVLDGLDATRSFDTGVPQVDASTQRSGAVSPDAQAFPREASELPYAFGRYQILRELGGGGMGKVYVAHDTQLDRQIALKIPKFRSDESADVVERFYREAQAMAALRHQNLCTVHDVGEIGGIHYLTMAYIEGRPLSQVIAMGRTLSNRTIAALIRKLAIALHQAHRAGVVHRDLKPANIIIDKDSQPVVVDFGLAWRARTDEEHLTNQGTVVGTPAYMSPEQVEGRLEAIGPASDIYSLGVILYQLLAGCLPFQGPLTSLFAQILRDEPRPPSASNPQVDPALETICLKAMAKAVARRFRSMEDMAADLGNYLKATAAAEAVTVNTSGSRRRPLMAPAELVVLCPECATRIETLAGNPRSQIECPHCHTEIMLRSGRSSPHDRVGSADAGVDEYQLAKPNDQVTATTANVDTNVKVGALSLSGETDLQAGRKKGEEDTTTAARRLFSQPWSPTFLAQFVVQSLLGIAVDIEFLLRWLVVSGVLCMCLRFSIVLVVDIQTYGFTIISAAFLIVAPCVVVLSSIFSTYCLAVFENYAAGKSRVEASLVTDVWESIVASRYVFVPVFFALVPGLIFSAVLGYFTVSFGVHLPILGVTLSALFPLFFLSAIESESVLPIFSPNIMRSLRIEKQTWRWFYGFSAAVVAVFLLFCFVMLTRPFIVAPFALFAICACPLVYFQLLGALYRRIEAAMSQPNCSSER